MLYGRNLLLFIHIFLIAFNSCIWNFFKFALAEFVFYVDNALLPLR